MACHPFYYDAPLLTLIEFDPDLFADRGEPRRGGCFAVHKGLYKKQIPETAGLPLVTDHRPESLAALFRSKEVFYCYDAFSCLSLLAAAAGCLSVVIPENGLSAQEWREKIPMMKYGIAYGTTTQELEWARATQDKVIGLLQESERESVIQVNNLIARMQP